MKKLFGKILVGTIGCVMALGLNAFAANQIGEVKIDANKETGKVIIEGTITGDAASPESTILVAPEGVSLLKVDDTNIKYIDQETVASGTFKYEFVLKTGAKYAVWFGGTEVEKPEEKEIDLTSGATAYKIVGTVSLLDGADTTKVTATATGKDPVNADAAGKYEIEVAPGTYDVVVGRVGYLFKTFSGVVVTDADKDLGGIALLAGDIVGGEDIAVIDMRDYQPLMDAYNATKGDSKYNADADLNDDGVIDIRDYQALMDNYNKTTAAYDAAE